MTLRYHRPFQGPGSPHGHLHAGWRTNIIPMDHRPLLFAAIVCILLPMAIVPAGAGSNMGKLVINSTPPGAMVILDNRVAGTTPMVIDPVTAGWHVIVLPKSGYFTWNAKKLVKMDSTLIIEAVLTPKPATVTATPTPTSPETMTPVMTKKTPVPTKTPGVTLTPVKTPTKKPTRGFAVTRATVNATGTKTQAR